MIDRLINPSECLFDMENHAALDRNLGPGYNTLLLRLIPEDLYSACSHRQFHTLSGFDLRLLPLVDSPKTVFKIPNLPMNSRLT